MLHKLLHTQAKVVGVQKQIDTFINREPAIVAFFSQKANKEFFFSKIADAPVDEIVAVRDYYLTLLHHIDRSDYYPYSFLLSASKSFSVAQKFVQKHVDSHDEIIFAGWVPQTQNGVLYSPFTLIGKQNVIRRYGLPTYRKSFFPNQEEVSLKGGLLPQYLIGYFYSNQQRAYFEVNPYFMNHSKEDWIADGLPIDQDEFWAKIKTTKYRRAFYYDPQDGYFMV